MRTQITLYGTDSQRFEDAREELNDRHPGSEPSNAEVVRMLMDEAGIAVTA